MLLALFLLSSVTQYQNQTSQPVTAGFPGHNRIELRTTNKVEEEFIEEAEELSLPTRGIDSPTDEPSF